MVIAGKGTSVLEVCLALVEIIIGEACHFSYTFEMKNADNMTTPIKEKPKKTLKTI